ncbi:C26 family cysteine hydrolase domain-containing family [Gordonia sp. TBRC 11910]|uniref:C26 family cysteine hydrolase domain-containing family n=1 Tax=Gordonia asplenii TaxID=2725283 RepID=A0A848L2A8_9ACTN|nr:gamma-glutamyl-gamma-aminobutyrate hydrolase family protein [Gordonia asplenii]NMO04562.1 C26 family cysteine hydrolase domain-containing family [Gordonia asplenii]
MRALILSHDHVSPAGPVGERLVERGYDVSSHQVVPAERFASPNVTTDLPDPTTFDAIVTMGAAWSVYDEATIGNWVGAEIDMMATADDAGVPVLGICFGGQVLATTHGGVVYRSSTPELGWRTVFSDDEGVVPGGDWFQWHYDRWDVPPKATELARNAASSQGFVIRRNLAVQFHPELNAAMLIGWLDNGGDRQLEAAGHDVRALIDDTSAREGESRIRAQRLVDGFLDVVARN